ncbi:hypothetical protein RRG08_065495, partial [Elysia crispata]
EDSGDDFWGFRDALTDEQNEIRQTDAQLVRKIYNDEFEAAESSVDGADARRSLEEDYEFM